MEGDAGPTAGTEAVGGSEALPDRGDTNAVEAAGERAGVGLVSPSDGVSAGGTAGTGSAPRDVSLPLASPLVASGLAPSGLVPSVLARLPASSFKLSSFAASPLGGSSLPCSVLAASVFAASVL